MRAEGDPHSDSFTLSKWYLDVVADDGHVVVGYWAELAWRRVVLRAESLLDAPRGAPASIRSRLTRGGGPNEREGTIEWSSPGLGVAGTWRSLARPIRRGLLKSTHAELEWDCRAPLADARLSVKGGAPIVGCGYADRVSLQMPSGALPFKELSWGRFASGPRWVVWIMWRGQSPLTLAWADGTEMTDVAVHDDRLELSTHERLTLERYRTLRAGMPVLESISHVPGLKRVVPRRLRLIDETKWLSRGVLSGPGSIRAEGWAIHERVGFGEGQP